MTDQAKNTLASIPALKRAELFQSLKKQDGYSQTEIAKKYGKSLPFVSNTLRLLTLPAIVRDGLASSQISEGHARALLTTDSREHMIRIYKKILIDKINVRETEKLARKK